MWAVSLIRDMAGPCFCEFQPLVNGGSDNLSSLQV